MNVLSLFDGISCGQIALNRANIKIDNYFASEIDKNSINVTQNNYPNTIQLGDINKINGKDLPKIDLLIGGSPCQGFSFAGKQLNFEDPRSKLFFQYHRLLTETNPTYFLLENVKMRKEYQDIISSYLGVQPIEINSALVSAQYRRRLYWTNIPNIQLPTDKKIFIDDIVEDNIGGNKVIFENGLCIMKAKNKKNIILESTVPPPYTVCETRTQLGKDKRKEARQLYGIDITPRGPNDREFRVHKKRKCNCIVTSKSELNCIVDRQYNYRYLTITELERLQNVPDNYTNYASDNQRWKMLGNGWTVDVISHIFSYLL